VSIGFFEDRQLIVVIAYVEVDVERGALDVGRVRRLRRVVERVRHREGVVSSLPHTSNLTFDPRLRSPRIPRKKVSSPFPMSALKVTDAPSIWFEMGDKIVVAVPGLYLDVELGEDVRLPAAPTAEVDQAVVVALPEIDLDLLVEFDKFGATGRPVEERVSVRG